MAPQQTVPRRHEEAMKHDLLRDMLYWAHENNRRAKTLAGGAGNDAGHIGSGGHGWHETSRCREGVWRDAASDWAVGKSISRGGDRGIEGAEGRASSRQRTAEGLAGSSHREAHHGQGTAPRTPHKYVAAFIVRMYAMLTKQCNIEYTLSSIILKPIFCERIFFRGARTTTSDECFADTHHSSFIISPEP